MVFLLFFADKFSIRGRHLVTFSILKNIPKEIIDDVTKYEKTEASDENKKEKVVLTRKILKIHQKIQREKTAIFFTPIMGENSIFGTNYKIYTDQQREMLREKLKELYLSEFHKMVGE